MKTTAIESTNTEHISVLYEDTDLLIVDKPANLLTVPGRGEDKQDCLINRLLVHYPTARIVHRLDMATSGVVVLALNHKAQVAMSQLFAERNITKTYTAVVSGLIDSSGCIELPLICDWVNRPKQMVDWQQGKAATTHFTRLSYNEDKTLSHVELQPITGRSHQLRVHLLAIGHPIVGDYFYAPENIKALSSRLLLHANALSFIHPYTNNTL